MKQQISPMIDMDVYLELKTRNVNISKIVNDFLKSYLDETGGEAEQLKREIEKLQREKAESTAKLQAKKEFLTKLEEKAKEKERKASRIIDLEIRK